ncbi:MAG: response regulator, partial [Lachnospiraceae bacterium]|nr:response regulator [Lachnospiraceae bacterium]
MLQIGVCDDDVQFTSKIEKMIIDIGHQKGILVEIDVFFDGSTLLEHIQKNDVRYDLLFLDIEMQDMNGLEVAKRIRKFDDLVYLIYITAHKNYAVEAYDVHPFQFILKPIKEEILKKHFLGVSE